MPVNLSIKNVPNEVVKELRERAKRHHRSLQGELLSILEETLVRPRLTIDEATERLKGLNFRTASESARMVREDRDAR